MNNQKENKIKLSQKNTREKLLIIFAYKNLSDQSQVAGIAAGKLPKFFIKDKWKPKSVISFTTSFRNSKSYVYCNDVDLIIYYGDKKPIQGNVDVIV